MLADIINYIDSKLSSAGKLSAEESELLLKQIKKLSRDDIFSILKNSMKSCEDISGICLYFLLDEDEIVSQSMLRKELKKELMTIKSYKVDTGAYMAIIWLECLLAYLNASNPDPKVANTWLTKMYDKMREFLVVCGHIKGNIKLDIRNAIGAQIEAEYSGEFCIIRAPGNEYLDEIEAEGEVSNEI